MGQAERGTSSNRTWRNRLTRRHLIGASVAMIAGVLAYPLVSRSQDSVPTDHRREALSTGLELHRQGRYEEAAQKFTDLLGSQPDLANAYLLRGIALSSAGQPEAAIPDFSRVLEEFRPDDAVVHLYRGDAYLARGLMDSAARDFQAAAAPAGNDDRIKVAAQAKLQRVLGQ
jgi:tetratricopeptide (TPR) repeat protein